MAGTVGALVAGTVGESNANGVLDAGDAGGPGPFMIALLVVPVGEAKMLRFGVGAAG